MIDFFQTNDTKTGCDMLSNGDGKQRLVEEWSEDEVTFVPDAKKKKRKVKRHGGDVATGWCKGCVTEAKSSGVDMGSWKSLGHCEVKGCPGYKGQHASARPQGEKTRVITTRQFISSLD